MSISRMSVAAFAAVACSLAAGAGTTYYADCTKGDDTGDGKSEATAKKYIQSAVGLCAKSGDTVIVLPGDYADDPATTASDGTASRVVIADKSVYLKARDGKAVTRITGAYSTDSTAVYNCGPGAIRCLAITGSDAANTVVEGFTLYRGATALNAAGGGYYATGVGYKAYVVDCDIVDCCGNKNSGGAAACNGIAVRCLFSRTIADWNGTCAVGAGRYVNCVFTGAECYYAFTANVYLFNCTVLCNAVNALYPWGNNEVLELYNTLSVANRSQTSGGGTRAGSKIYNSVSSGSGKCFSVVQDSETNVLATIYQVVSPMSGDLRLTSDSAARNVGRAEWLSEKLDSFGAPATVDFYRDFAGHAIPKTGTIHAGAVQSVATVASSGAKGNVVLPSGSGIMLNGFHRYRTPVANQPTYAAWFMSEAFPCQVKIGWDRYVERIMYYKDGNDRYKWLPDGGGDAYVTIPDSSVTYSLDAVSAKKVYHVDCSRADDSGDGLSEMTAKRTIQAAVSAAKDAGVASLVLVKPGVYDDGYVVIGGLRSRVGFVSGSPATYVKSTGGRDVTFIRGADDPEGDANGLGNNAVRCVGFECNSCYLQGFTLTGGRTANASGTADSMKQGGGVYSADFYIRDRVIADCVVTNNRAWRYGGMCKGSAIRSHFADNRRCDNTTGFAYAYQTSAFISCLVRVEQKEEYAFDGNCFVFNSTVDWVGAPAADTSVLFNSGARYANSILFNCRKVQLYDSASGLFLVGCDLYGTTFVDTYVSGGAKVEGYSYVTDSPMFASRRQRDYRPANARLLVASESFTAPNYSLYQLMDRDIDGRPFLFTDGKTLPGAHQELGEVSGVIMIFR